MRTIVTLTYGDPKRATRNAIADDLRHLISVHPYDAEVYVDRFEGSGYYNGKAEHSGVIVASIAVTYNLRSRVARIAADHRQDCIGMILADETDTLVYSTEQDNA